MTCFGCDIGFGVWYNADEGDISASLSKWRQRNGKSCYAGNFGEHVPYATFQTALQNSQRCPTYMRFFAPICRCVSLLCVQCGLPMAMHIVYEDSQFGLHVDLSGQVAACWTRVWETGVRNQHRFKVYFWVVVCLTLFVSQWLCFTGG